MSAWRKLCFKPTYFMCRVQMANGRGLNENHCQFWQRNTTLGFVTRIETWKFAVAGVGRRNQNLFKYSHIARCGIVLWLSGGAWYCVVIVGRPYWVHARFILRTASILRERLDISLYRQCGTYKTTRWQNKQEIKC